MEIKSGAHTTKLPETTPTMSHEEWLAEGRRRFGDDFTKWRFVCPICGNVASIGDYRAFKDQGATSESAMKECIGRYTGTEFKAFEGKRGKPCDYAIYGLFRIPGVVIEMADGDKVMAFAFADAES